MHWLGYAFNISLRLSALSNDGCIFISWNSSMASSGSISYLYTPYSLVASTIAFRFFGLTSSKKVPFAMM